MPAVYRNPNAIVSIIDSLKYQGFSTYRGGNVGRPNAAYAALSAIEQGWGTHPLVTGIIPPGQPPPRVIPGPTAQVVTAADQAGLQQLLSQGVRGTTASDAQLLAWQLEDRLRLNPGDDFARVMLQQTKKKARKKLGKAVARKLAARALALVPGAGWVATAVDAATMLGPIIAGSQKAAIDRLVSGLTNKQPGSQTGPSSRPTPKTKTQPKREVPVLDLPTVTRTRDRLPDPGAIPTPTPDVKVQAEPLALDNPLLNPEPEPPTRKRPGPAPAPWPGYSAPQNPPGIRYQPRPRARVRPGPSPGRSRGGSSPGELLRRFAEQQSRPLTATQSDRGQSGNDECKCQTEKKQRKKRKPRSICYRGTFTERANGLTKRKLEKVPCR